MRIVDHLRGREEEGMEASEKRRRRRGLAVSLPPSTSAASAPPVSNACYSPRFLVSRWLQRTPPTRRDGGGEGVVGCRVRFPRHCCRKRSVGDKDEVEESEEEVTAPPRDPDTGETGVMSSVASAVEGPTPLSFPFPGRKPEEVSFNQGLSLGLLLLLATSATEFDKMKELKMQMEILLKDIKDEVHRKDAMSGFAESNHDLDYSVSNFCGNGTKSKNTSFQHYKTPCHMVGANCYAESDRQSKCEISVQNNRNLKMDRMEAELEVELEHLQLGMKGKKSSVRPQHQMMELATESTNPSESSSVSLVEDNEPKEEESSRYGAVSARELERRLHELLEAQQEERIAQLESALELAGIKLHEKEVEICWWRDTARLASQHKDGTFFSQ